MAVGFRSADKGLANGATSVVVPYPSGISAGDLLMLMEWGDTDGAPTAFTLPSGWTQTGGDIAKVNSSPQGRLFYKAASGSETGTLSCAASNAASTVSSMVALTGADTSDPIRTALALGSGSGTNLVAPSLSGGQIGDMLLTFHAAQRSGTALTFTPPGDMTEAIEGWIAYCGSSINYQVLSSTSATGTKTATIPAIQSGYRTGSIIIKQGAAAPTGPEPGRFLLAV